MGNYNPSFRSDARQVTRATAGGAVWFWPLILGIGIIGWICQALARIPARIWLSLGIGIGVLVLVIGAVLLLNLIDKANSPEIRMLEWQQEELERQRREHLDLRQSDEFTGQW